MRKFFSFLILFSFANQTIAAQEVRSLQARYDAMVSFYHEESWDKVIEEGKQILEEFYDANLGIESNFYLGIAYFHTEDFDFSNRYLSKYLKDSSSAGFFEKALTYKFLIAENFRLGAKKHLAGWEKTPKWLSALDDAIEIYDEIISAYPYDKLGVKALYGKGIIYKKNKNYSKSLEAFQCILQRFPADELAIESYLEIGDIYVKRCEEEHLDPDWLELAEMNLKRFQEAFPGEKRIVEAKTGILQVKESFARDLFETGRFYERTKKPQAAEIYYAKILSQFSDTHTATKAKARLEELQVQGS